MKRLPQEYYDNWIGLFNIERKKQMTWTKESIKIILANPFGKTDGLCNSNIIGRMLLALLDQQTAQEKDHHATKVTNGVGFNKFDADILTGISNWYKRNQFLTDRQLRIVARKLVKYAGQLEHIAELNRKDNTWKDHRLETKTIDPGITIPKNGMTKEFVQDFVEKAKGDVLDYGEMVTREITNIIPERDYDPADDEILEL